MVKNRARCKMQRLANAINAVVELINSSTFNNESKDIYLLFIMRL